MDDDRAARPFDATPLAPGDATSANAPVHAAAPDERLLAALQQLFEAFDGRLHVRLWDGSSHEVGSGRRGAAPGFTLVCRTAEAVGTLLLGRDPLRLAEAYFHDDIDVEGDFFDALQLKDQLATLKLPLRKRLAVLAPALLAKRAAPVRTAARASTGRGGRALHAPRVTAHTRDQNQGAVSFHYDLSNAFYRLWLDREMVYSCAYFERPDATLEEAQRAKLDLICRKLQLAPGQSLLDIGCGWGALVLHAAQHYGVRALGVTLSAQQHAWACERVAATGLAERVRIERMDYRDLPARGERFDRIASVGMFEHVGLQNLPTYFATAKRLLQPGGLFLNHGITHSVEGWQPQLSSAFINRYVFPDGQLDTIGNIVRGMERADFEIADVEALRPHYALTLRAWVARLEARHDEALSHVSEATWRVWRLYMAGSALEFESGELGVFQILATHRGAARGPTPLTRAHMVGR